MQEVRISRDDITLCCSSSGYAGRAEDISVAEREAGVVENAEHIHFRLEVGPFGKVEIPDDGHVEHAKAGRSHAVSSHGGERAGPATTYRALGFTGV